MKFDILKRFSAEIVFSAEIEANDETEQAVKLGLAVRAALKDGANLDGANLDGANLDGATMIKADLRFAKLQNANLYGANLDGANLYGANLDGANLDGATMIKADLRFAKLQNANLYGANLYGANLDGANLDKADLRVIKHDLWGIFLRYQPEVLALLETLREGKIDGSVYNGACACLMGTIANIKHCDVETLPEKNSSSPAEKWFLAINEDQTPENHVIAKITEGWILEFIGLITPSEIKKAA